MEQIRKYTDWRRRTPDSEQQLCKLVVTRPDGRSIHISGAQCIDEYRGLCPEGHWDFSSTDTYDYLAVNLYSDGKVAGGSRQTSAQVELLLLAAEKRGWDVTGTLPRV